MGQSSSSFHRRDQLQDDSDSHSHSHRSNNTHTFDYDSSDCPYDSLRDANRRLGVSRLELPCEQSDFEPPRLPEAESVQHDWMRRSIESLILGQISPSIALAISENDESQNQRRAAWIRYNLSTRGSLDYSQFSSSLNPRVRRAQGGTLANYFGDNSLSSSYHGSSATSNRKTIGPNIVLSLLAREATGHSPNSFSPTTRLRQMGGKTLYQNLDRSSGGILTEVMDLKFAIECGNWVETSKIVSRLTPRLMGDPTRPPTPSSSIDDPSLPASASPFLAGGGRLGLERDAFVLGGGVQVFLRIFTEPGLVGSDLRNDARRIPPSIMNSRFSQCWNEVLVSLRELVYAIPILVENGTILDNGGFLPFLFTLLSHDCCFDTAAAVIEEILSLLSQTLVSPTVIHDAPIDNEFRAATFTVPARMFFLGNVPNLYSLWRGFNCRKLAHFCRILALLVFEPEDRQLLESSAVLKSMELLQLRRDRAARAGRDATVDMNQSIVMGDKILMQRLLQLLKVMNYAPSFRHSSAHQVIAQFPYISETLILLGLTEIENWSDVTRMDALAKQLLSSSGEQRNLCELGAVASMLESLSATFSNNAESLESSTQLGQIIRVILAAQESGLVIGRQQNRLHEGDTGSSIHLASVPLEASSFQSVMSAATTFNDPLNNLHANTFLESEDLLLGIRTQESSDEPLLQSRAQLYSSTNLSRVSLPQDAANELQFNALLLSHYQVEVLFVLCTLLGGRRKIDAQRFLNEHGIILILNDMFSRLSFGTANRPLPTRDLNMPYDASTLDQGPEPTAGIFGPGCDCTPESALCVQYLRLVHNFCDRDCDNYVSRRLLLSSDERKYIFSERIWQDSQIPEDLTKGLFSMIILSLSEESDDSPYRFWLASCAESYLRGSAPNEQLFAAKSGLLSLLVRDITSNKLHCAGSLQTSFDLLGEICKGNSQVLYLLVSTFDEENFRNLMSAAAANLVDSNVFLRSLLLTIERISAARIERGLEEIKCTNFKRSDSYSPWIGCSGSSSRFYFSHSWWEIETKSIEKSDGKKCDLEKLDVEFYEKSYDEARSSDWFPADCVLNGPNHICNSEVSSLASSELEDWQFIPHSSLLLPEEDRLAWIFNESVFLPNTIERIAWFLITNQSRLLRDLLCVVDLQNVNHENICCLNTAVVVAIFANRRNQLSSILHDLRKMNRIRQEFLTKERDASFQGDENQGIVTLANAFNTMDDLETKQASVPWHKTLSPLQCRNSDILENFRELLWFWTEYYTHRGRDRLSLEFSSHIRFHEWSEVVSKLSADDGSSTALSQSPLKMARSPYQRAARILDTPRRTS